MTLDLTRIALQTRRDLQQQSNIELNTVVSPVYLTLTRTTTVNVGTVGAVIAWQQEIYASGITWSGSRIFIPSDGYYLIDIVGRWNSSGAQTYGRIYVNSVLVEIMTNNYITSDLNFRVMGLRYYSQNDYVEIVLINPGGTRTLQIIAYDLANNSPYLHFVKLA